MWPLFYSRRGRQSKPRGTWTFTCPRSPRLGEHTVQAPAPAACCSTMMTQVPVLPPPLWTTWSQLHSAGQADPVFPGLSVLWFLSVPSSEAAAEGKAVSEHRRCLNLFQRCHFWHSSVNMVWHLCHMVWKDDWLYACWGGYRKNLDQARNLYMRLELHIQKLMGYPLY